MVEQAESAAAQQPLSGEDQASPLPDDLLGAGQEFIARNEAAQQANKILADAQLPLAVGQEVLYSREVAGDDGSVRRGDPERVFVLDAVPGDEFAPAAVKIWRDGTPFELDLPLSGEFLTAAPTPEQQAEQADFARFEGDVAEALRSLDTPEQRNAALRAELDTEGAAALDALPAERRSAVLGAVKKRIQAAARSREDEQRTGEQDEAARQQEADEALQFDQDFQNATDDLAEQIGPEGANSVAAETRTAMGLEDGPIPAARRKAYLKLYQSRGKSALRQVRQQQQEAPAVPAEAPRAPQEDVGPNAALETQQQPTGALETQQQPTEAQDRVVEPSEPVAYQPVERARVFTAKNTEHEVEYAIVELDSLIASHDEAGNVNPAYPPELQPRDRTRVSYQDQINEIVTEFNPALMDRSPTVDGGAPTIAPSGVVESGNGRTIALRRIYDEGNGEAYRQYLAEQGYPVEEVEKPVLVRIRRSELTPQQRLDLTREANQDTKRAMSRTEQAFADAEAMPEGLMALHEGGATDMARNREFVREFVERVVPGADRSRFMDSGGQLTAEGIQRIEAAAIAKAFGGRALVERLAEAADPGRRTVRSALVEIAPEWAKMREAVQTGTLQPEIDQTGALVDAVQLMDRSVRTNTTLSALVHQKTLFEEEEARKASPHGQRVKSFVAMFYADPGPGGYKKMQSAPRIAEALRSYLRSAQHFDPRESALFTEAETPPIERMLQGASGERPIAWAKKQYGVANKGITRKRAAEAVVRLRSALLQPEDQSIELESQGSILAEFHLEAGGRNFSKYSTAMQSDLGQAAEPYLQSWYDAAAEVQPEQTPSAPEQETEPSREARPVEPSATEQRPLTAEEAERIARLPEILETVLKRIAPQTEFRARDVITDGRAGLQGRYSPYNRLVEVALDPRFGTKDATAAVHHEAVHALKQDGLFSDAEWRVLRDEARDADWIGRYRIRERYAELFSDGEPTDAAYEEAIADAFGDWSRKRTGWKDAVVRAFAKIRRFLRQLRSALLKDGWEPTAEDIFSDIAAGAVGARTPTQPGATATQRESRPDTPQSDAAGQTAEERFRERQKGLKADGPGLLASLKEQLDLFAQGWVRNYQHLPRTARFANAHEWLRSLVAAPAAASGEVERHVTKLVDGLDERRLDLLTRKVFMDDFYEDVKQGMKVPFWDDPDEFMDSYRETNAEIERDSELLRRVRWRRAYVRNVAKRMVEAGVISPSRLQRKNYIRHQVIEYAQAELRASRTKGVSKPKWARRMGTTLEINTNLLEVESSWLQKALVDIRTARAIRNFAESDYNRRDALKKTARDHNKELADALVVEEFRTALRNVPAAASFAEQIETPADIERFFQENAQDFDNIGKLLATPVYDQLKAYRRRIAIGFSGLRKNLSEQDVPNHLRKEYELLMGRVTAASEESVFPLVIYAALELDGDAATHAGSIQKSVNARRQFLRDQLGDDYIPADNMKRILKRLRRAGDTEWDGYEAWQPDTGRLLLTGLTIPEHVMHRLQGRLQEIMGDTEGFADMFPAQEVEWALDAIREQLVVGGPKFELVLPSELVETLNSLGDTREHHWLVKLSLSILQSWKIWTLVNPRSWSKYQSQNLSGDLDGVIAAYPQALRWKNLESAVRELWHVAVRKGTPSAVYQEAAERGVIDGGWAISEVYDVQADIEGIVTKPDIGKREVKRIWNFLKRSTTFRENILRYAAYLHLREEIAQARKQNPARLTEDLMPIVGYGAGNPAVADAISDDADRAAYLSRETLGDYGAISVNGQLMRRWVVPFWSWQEINVRRYLRLASNIWAAKTGFGRAATLSALGARVGTRAALWLTFRLFFFNAAVTIWNNLFFGDLEDELRDEDRRRLHLILGKHNDEIYMLRTPGALSDFLGAFGYDDVRAALTHIEKGRGTWRDVAAAVAAAPANRFINGITPYIKVTGESISGLSFFPDAFNPRTIVDRSRHAAQTIKLEYAHDYLLGKPTQGFEHFLASLALDRRHSGYSAYAKIRGEAYHWKRAVKGEEGGPRYMSERSVAYHYYRLALKFGDRKAALRYRKRLAELKVTREQMKAMIDRAHPLGMLTKTDRRRFYSNLNDEEKRSLSRAVKWWRQTYRQGSAAAARQ